MLASMKDKLRMKLVKFSVNEEMDWISKLPVHIIHYILSFLPIKDAGRTCILSKTWQTLCSSYGIHSYLHFDHNSFALQLLLSTENGQQEPEIYEIRDRFMDYAEAHLLKVIRQQSPVLELAFDVAVIGSEFGRVDQFMELVQNAKVEELSIFVQTQDFRWYENMFEGNLYYQFPYSFLQASKCLRSLTIQGCKFTGPLLAPGNNLFNNNAGMFSSLQQLWLSQVMLLSDEALSNVASCCPEIELIEFDCCSFDISTLKLSKFPKLKKAFVVDLQYGLGYVDITETNLESFQCIGGSVVCLINLAACSNIRKLVLSSCFVAGCEHYLFKDLTTSFPLLEQANLQDVEPFQGLDVEPFRGLDNFTASNFHLRTLKLLFNHDIRGLSLECPNLRYFKCMGTGVEEFYMNCPKLRKFYYSGSIPVLIKLDLPTDIEYIFFKFCVWDVLHMSWFISIRKILEQIRGCNDVYLHLSARSTNMVEFVLDEFGAFQTSRPNRVHLQVEIYNSAVVAINISEAFVDSLIWSTQPATLSVGGNCCDFVKHLCEKLAGESQDKSCCDQQLCNKYWWHNLTDFRVEYEEEDMKQNLAYLVEICKEKRISHFDNLPFLFEFEWHSSERVHSRVAS